MTTDASKWLISETERYYPKRALIEDVLSKLFNEDASGVTSSIDIAGTYIGKVRPNWWWSGGLCSLSGHASIGPDYNGPARAELLAQFPEEQFDSGFHADLVPGNGAHRVCLALINCLAQSWLTQHDPAG